MSRSGELSQCKQCKDNGLVGSLRRGFGGVLMITARCGARAVLWLRVRHSALSPILSPRTTQPQHANTTAITLFTHVYAFHRFSFSSQVLTVMQSLFSIKVESEWLFNDCSIKEIIYWTDEWMIVHFLLLFNLETTISEQAPVLGSYTSHKKLFYGYNVERPHL